MERSAYTLIEILIVISITGILLGLGFAGFRQYSQRQVLFAAARDVKSDLRSLQGKAISGEKPTACAGELLDGYKFDIISNILYRMSALCSGNVVVNIQDKNVGELGFTVEATIDPIIFKALGQGTDIPLSTGFSTITLTQTGTGKTIQITVSAEGSIK